MRNEGKAKSLATLKEILKPMTWKERLDYLWEYYKTVAIITVVIIALVASLISAWLQPEIIYEGLGVNIDLPNDDDITYVTEDWVQKLGANPKKETARYSSIFVGELKENVDPELAMGAQKVMLMLIAESLDYILMDDQAVEFYMEKDVFGSLELTFTEEQLQQLEDRLIYWEIEGNKIPVVLDISDTPLAKNCGVYGEGLYIAFPGNTGRTELNDDFLEHLLQWEPAE